MNAVVLFYTGILIDIFFIQLLLYFNLKRLSFIEDLILNHLVSTEELRAQVKLKSQELKSKLQDICVKD